MPNLRSILSLILVIVTTLLVSCSSPQVSKIPTTYTPEKIEQLQRFVEPVVAARDKMPLLESYISSNNWVDAKTLIHGPLGQLRRDMISLSNSLLQKDQKQAAQLAREVFGHFERLDGAAQERNAAAAEYHYSKAVKDFDAFLNLIPKA